MTYTDKILAEFDSLYEEHKEILDIPVCCTNEDCLCNKDTVWEHLKAFLTSKIAQAYQEGYEDLSGNFCLEVKEHDNKIREEMLKRVVEVIFKNSREVYTGYSSFLTVSTDKLTIDLLSLLDKPLIDN